MLILVQGSQEEFQKFRHYLERHGISHDYKLRQGVGEDVLYFVEPNIMTEGMITHISQYITETALSIEVEIKGERYSLSHDLAKIINKVMF